MSRRWARWWPWFTGVPGARTGLAAFALLATTGLLVLAGPADSQQPRAPGAPGTQAPSADTVELIFEREVFEYPAFQRRNPFRPLTGDDAGPRFEELALLGVILSGDGVGSVALLGPRGATAGRGATARTWRVREGDFLGNVRVLAIRQREILVEVDEFGVRETRVLELRRTEPEAMGDDDDPPGGDPPEEDDPAPPGGGDGGGGAPSEPLGAGADNGRNGGSA
jgi:hypothetical protein